MITANELRIGCIVNFNGKYKIIKTYDDLSESWLNEYSPIPLNPEILVDCGFEQDISSQYGGYLIAIGEGEKIRIINDESHGWHYPLNGYQRPKTNYLHQLQNLYFALTGIELEYKLNKTP